ncbi:hypothetical protein LTR08_004201 [Meristemomyces frigidus]|nr:hypothetical protein LTR08_004201 [Meristemomyces frigidus]
MAGLRPFSQAWRPTGTTGKTAQDTPYGHHEDDASLPSASHARRRQAGIREYTDESCTLSSSADILQHVAESCRDVHCQNIGTDLRRATSYGSTNAGDSSDIIVVPYMSDSYEAIEANINELKKEVGKLKEDRGSREDWEQDSAAARLQKAHDKLKEAVRTALPGQSKTLAPPSPMEFPALGSGKSTTSSSANHSIHNERRPSYASAATSGMKDAIDKAGSTSRAKRSDSKVLDTLSDSSLHSHNSSMQHGVTLGIFQANSSASVRHHHEYDEESGSVIVSHGPLETVRCNAEGIIVSKSTPSTPNGKPSKEKPHFAQPTASFAQRAGETLHKDAISATLKPGDIDASPSKRVNKRKSLPGDWLGSKSLQRTALSADPISSPLIFSSPIESEEWQMVDKAATKTVTLAAKPHDGPQHTLRKKTSSYMSPTAATTQRTIATLGEETNKRKTGTLRINTLQTNRYSSLSSPESAALSSANSTAHSALERSGLSSAVSPPSPHRLTQRALDGIMAKGSLLHSPKTARQVVVDKKTMEAKSPSKIPRARRTLDAQLQQATVNAAKAAANVGCTSSLDAVANTVTRRRTSHADILKPIIDKLDSQGLRRNNPDPSNVNGYKKPDEIKIISKGDTRGQYHIPLEEMPRKPSAALTDLALLVRQGMGGPKTVVSPHILASRQSSVASVDVNVPPHLRTSRQFSGTSISTESSTVNIYTTRPSAPCPTPTLETDDTHTAGGQVDLARHDASFQVKQTAAYVQLGPQAAPFQKGYPALTLPAAFGNHQTAAQLQAATKLMPAPRPVNSLRATAASFTPLWQPQTLVQQLRLLSWEGKLDPPEETLSTMPSEVKNSIQLLREYKNTGGRVLSDMTPGRSPSPSKRQEQRFWGNLMAQTAPTPAAHAGAPKYDRDGDVTMTNVGEEQVGRSKTETASQYGVQVGQVLKSALSPGKKSVKWTLQDTDGQEKPVTFGRAAPPPHDGHANDTVTYDTPIMSPTSDDTSPIKTPLSAHAWTIGSGGFAPAVYGWKGGDGKEISFSGYGPHAERDPNSPMNVRFFNERSNAYGSAPPMASPSSASENAFPSPKVWPRSMKQWAELAGYNRVPCASMEIMGAVEQMPGALQSAGLCNDCAGGH